MDRKSEAELFRALRDQYPAAEYALFPQVANGTGSRATRHADAVAMSLWPSRGLFLTGFEMKSYRGDWVKELKNPQKAEAIAQYCHQWYIVAGGPFVDVDELPPLWGLWQWDETAGKLTKKKAAKHREEVSKADLPFIAAILRSAQGVVTPDGVVAEAAAKAYADGLAQGELKAKYIREDYERLQKIVADFEKASGVELNQWSSGKDIGKAVNDVLHGNVQRNRLALLRIAQRIVADMGDSESEEEG